jgi:hypothetical protein
MRSISTYLCFGLMTVGMGLADHRQAQAQYPYTINTAPTYIAPAQAYAPAIVGYTAERRGLFGRRTVYRPVLGPSVAQPIAVAAPVETITQATAFAGPSIAGPSIAGPSVAAPFIAAPPIAAARPVIQAPMVYSTPVVAAPMVVSQRVVTTSPVIVARPVIGAPAPIIMARPMLAPAMFSQPVIIGQPPVINRYYPPVYPAPFAPVSGF